MDTSILFAIRDMIAHCPLGKRLGWRIRGGIAAGGRDVGETPPHRDGRTGYLVKINLPLRVWRKRYSWPW